MSEFDGHLVEYPFVSIDKFTEDNYSSSVYFLSHYHLDHIEGLLEQTFLQRLLYKLPPAKLYTSETTLNLMKSDPDAADILPFVIGLPIHQHTSIDLQVHPEQGEGEPVVAEDLVVTLITAGHCVGSVMFLFEGSKGAVLFTGDFRLRKEDISKVSCLHSGSAVIGLKSMYVDTTFLCPTIPLLPTRQQTKDAIISIIESWITKGEHHVVHLKCKGKYGYEYIMKEIAQYFNTKIHVNDWRMQMSTQLTDMLPYFTTDKTSTQIHCCYYGKKSTGCNFSLPCGLQLIDGKPAKVKTIVPSCMYFIIKGMPDDWKVYLHGQNLWRVAHSMHASYNEIRDVVGYLRPKNIYPFVPPVDCQDIWMAYQRLKDLTASETSDYLDLSKSTDLSSDSLCWRETLRREPAKLNTAKNDIDVELGLSTTKDDLRSPPPKKRRRKKMRANYKVDREEEKAHENDFSQTVMDAFECFTKNDAPHSSNNSVVQVEDKQCRRMDRGNEDVDELLEELLDDEREILTHSSRKLEMGSYNQSTEVENDPEGDPVTACDLTEHIELNHKSIRAFSNDEISCPAVNEPIVDSGCKESYQVYSKGSSDGAIGSSSISNADDNLDIVVIGSSSPSCTERGISDSLDTASHQVVSKASDDLVVVSDSESTDSDKTLSLNGSFERSSQL